jgi:hypothetical protein
MANGVLRVIACFALFAYLLFAHGCHSEADTELSTSISESSSAAP